MNSIFTIGGFRPHVLQGILILALAFWIYLPIFHGDWLWDDGLLIKQNALIHDPQGFWKIWLQPFQLIDYLPITVTVEWLEWHIWGEETLGYHITTFVLHLIGALLVWRLLDKINLRLAWLGGLLFAIHPVMVESVAWISELKNTLSLPPFLLAMCAWIDYDRAGKRGDYFRAIGLILIAMLCKATMIMFPVLILLHAWWRRGRIDLRDLKASAPFFAVSLVIGVITLHYFHPAMGEKIMLPEHVGPRVALVGTIIAFYFSKCVLPLDLLPIYPKWPVEPLSPFLVFSWLILLGVVAWCWSRRSAWGGNALLGLGFFLINLFPFMGFTPAPYMSFTWVMNHILYIPIIGLIGLFVAACDQVETRLSRSVRSIFIGALAVLLTLLVLQSRSYAKNYLSQETLWSYELKSNPGSEVAHNNLGFAYLGSGRFPQAIEQFNAALRINPNYAFAHNSLGNALFMTGHADEAMAHYQEALRIDPKYPEAHNGIANILLQSGKLDEAKAECEAALKFNPEYVEAHCNLGLILARLGQLPAAIDQFEIAQKNDPSDQRIGRILDQLRAQEGAAK